MEQKQAIYRILDANLDRAREGLRIIEEWCRFGLNNQTMAESCKQMRQELSQWHSPEIRAARDTVNDVGTTLTHPKEEKRENLDSVLLANLCRIQEALRVLEEYSKLINGKFALTMKQMRYQVYTLESQLMNKNNHQLLSQSSLYLVTSPVENLYEVVESALQGGLKLVQYRHKDETDVVRYEQASKLKQLCHKYNALFLVNDRIDLALAVNADGVHLGQTDLPISVARQLLGKDKIIGKSTTNPEEMKNAIADQVDYIGVGPVYETPTKAGKKAAGLEYVRYAQENASIPWFAIGGIDETNIEDVVKAGATNVAVVRAIMVADNPKEVTQNLLKKLS
ncbi:thiamine phosphate synthase [Cyanobacterium aponinum UTEX 3222]|uniref:Thiamine-phosphate synthase n=1 Tax=Cyanobacterium aponinum 0216 TaxID=2676140 RepID=A0A844GVZ2_9CHRO|nr:thiamine phosphate synthase [Cyanobacterium aponinum]WRL42193.1 thiamine phosphate synthase [Cyanobacterium aponinum UTEX 3222]MBD2395927.1 thiamine phosphate synthase [Cyanobacterium aponinum FACHB-4101]MTF40617.1 thiamine phosphate synthase [Cyanobacterium aponinum 0216]PHV61134.1 thiamine phosphate synthase [Cyanobacterium aponinum IPPAS B-1201]WRL38608.1 thiamine phosphate synthase [Cyanobacterium aponinum UTEX 3221]